MVKKIILLSVAFVTAVSSAVYGGVTKATPVSSGTGTGTSAKISDVSALSGIMSRIPSYDDYTSTENITELYPDFQSFTMMEIGYGTNEKESPTSRKVVKNGKEETVSVIQKTKDTTNHTLSISFTEDAVYYHTVGSKITVNEYFECEMTTETHDSDTYTYYTYERNEDFVDAERTTINFDAEIYHSKETTLLKYNHYETIEEVSDRLNQENECVFTAAPEETVTDEDEKMEKEMQAKVNKIKEDNYGVWLKLETYSDEELAAKFEKLENPDPNISEEEYKNLMLDYMVYQTCSLVSEAEAKSFATANESNCLYLSNLSAFITSDENDFEKISPNEYKLITSKSVEVQVGTDEFGEPICETKIMPVGKNAYITTLFGNTYTNEEKYYTNANLTYVLASDVAIVEQQADWSTHNSYKYSYGLDQGFKMNTTTIFSAVNNTVAEITKGAKVKTVAEAYGKGLRGIYSDYIDKMMSGEEN